MFVIQNVACNTELKSILAYLRHWTKRSHYVMHWIYFQMPQAKLKKINEAKQLFTMIKLNKHQHFMLSMCLYITMMLQDRYYG